MAAKILCDPHRDDYQVLQPKDLLTPILVLCHVVTAYLDIVYHAEPTHLRLLQHKFRLTTRYPLELGWLDF